jgi:hypothetical protein
MTGIGTLMIQTIVIDRAAWDALVQLVTTFKNAHPEIKTTTFHWEENTTA